MKCVTCARERKLKLAKSDKFCTLRCMKSWMESNPGRKPEDAEPNDKNSEYIYMYMLICVNNNCTCT